MRWSQTFLFTMKEPPADAEIVSHQLFMRAGIIKKVAPGIFTYSQIGLRAIRKLETIIREELAKINCDEILMPMVQPRSLWDESGRWPHMSELLKFKNKNDQDFCLGATHEEVVSDFVRKDLKSYRDLPVSLYQIQTKYRDEIRPRFGLMRGREFIMKDAYTFDESKEKAQESYEKMRQAYHNIFKRVGFEFRAVEADTGAIGGNQSHEFQVLSESGMDKLFICDTCDYASNEEITPVIAKVTSTDSSLGALEKFETPGLKTIADLAKNLKVSEESLVKTFFVKFTHEKDIKYYCALIPGHREVNMIKLKKVLNETVDAELASDEDVLKISGARPGSCGPVQLKMAIPIVLDQSLSGKKNMIVGANEDGFHFKNVNLERDFRPTVIADIALAQNGDSCPVCSGHLKSVRGSEVGHIFYLGKKYSQAMNVNFLDRDGQNKIVEMGCYGIGVTRTVQAAIEQAHDADGMIWPAAIAPFVVHVCLLDQDEKINATLESVLAALDEARIDYFVDDRQERPGVKFKDADLLGSPLRLTFGKKGIEAGHIELTDRKTKAMQKISLGDAPKAVVTAAQLKLKGE